MKKAPLRVLMIEDVEQEAQLALRELTRSGFDVSHERVDSASSTAEALDRGPWDLVICDYSMHQFDAPSALAVMREKGLDLPFIIVSGTIGEETAVAAMRAGAHDFFHKDKLGPRFAAAIERELNEAKLRQEQAATERALQRSREHIDRVLALSRFVLFSFEPTADASPTFVSSNVEQVIGYSVEECLEDGWWDRGVHPEDYPAAKARLSQLLEQGQLRHEYRFRHKDGSWRWISDDQKLVRDASGSPVSVIGGWNDITERLQMEKQLMISDRMVSLGTLAAGVAHEINNPLAALMANLDHAAEGVGGLARNKAAAGIDGLPLQLREIGEVLGDAREAAERVRLIVRDLKLFSRADEESRTALDIRQVIESSLRMAWNELRHRAQLVKDFDDVPPVLGNEARLGQVFLNLVVNAAQAIPDGRAHENEVRIVVQRRDPEWVVVEVHDTGSGIPETVLTQIFDPFFTTKAIGMGTGLGLAICHRIVTSLGGQIEVESQLGKGSVFRTLLPIARDDQEAENDAVRETAEKEGRILVVDDEPALGTAIRRMLATEHEVLAVTSAREALELISKGERFDVILCDLMMPELTGMDLHAELLEMEPLQASRMIFMTGGAFTGQARDFLAKVRNPRIEKPFDIAGIRPLIDGLLR